MVKRIGCFVALALVYAGCMAVEDRSNAKIGITAQEIALAEYSASNTNSATNASTTAQIPIAFNAGETIMIGTQGLTESTFSGDTFLRLRNSSLVDLATSDDSCATLASRLSFTAPSAATHTIWAGCFGGSSCGNISKPNVVAISRQKGTYVFSASNTNDATVNTVNQQFFFNGGETIRVSTCLNEAAGASATNDTYLRLFSNNGGVLTQIASNDNASSTCGCGVASLIMFTTPSAGFYQVRAGCSLNTSCGGTVAIYSE
jgi:hypothetical protein